MENLDLPGLPWPLPEEEPPAFRAGLVSARPCPPESEFLARFSVDDQLHEPRWQVTGHVKMEGSRIVIAEMTIRPHPDGTHLPAGGVNRPLLATVKTSELLRGVRWALADFHRRVEIDHGRGSVGDAFRERVARAAGAAAAAGPSVPGRKGTDPALYLELAIRYLDLQGELTRDSTTARGIIDCLAREPWPSDVVRGNSRVSKDTIKSRLRKCAELGYLKFAGAGRAGAEKGPRMLEEEANAEGVGK